MKRNNLHLVVGFIALAVSTLFIVGGVMLLSIPVVSEYLTKFWAIALAVLCFIIGFFAISIAFAGFTYKLKDYKLEEQKRKENLDAYDKFNASIEEKNKIIEEQKREELRRQNVLEIERNSQERQRKLRERKRKIEKVENVKSFMSKVFNHALTEWKKYQGGEKCEIRLMTIDYEAENEKLVVIYKVSVVVLGSRRSARSAVESAQLYAVKELEKELNKLYFDRWYNGIGQDAAPLPIDRVILRVELTNRGAG